MSNISVITKEIFLESDTICPDCANKIQYIISQTNSQYTFCEQCGYNNNTIKKHIAFDKIFKSIQEYFKIVNTNTNNELIIYGVVSNEILSVHVNNEVISKIQLLFTVNEKDMLSLKHTIEELLEDSFDEGSIKSSVNIFS